MKNTYKLIAISALTLAIALPVMAQSDTPSQPQDEGQNPPSLDSMPTNGQPSIRARIRADINARVENADNNRGIRNMMLEHRIGSSTTMHGDMEDGETASGTPRFGDDEHRGPRPFMASSTMMGSTTRMHDHFGDEDDNGRDMHVAKFEERKRIVTEQFDVAIRNLDNISSRLGSRIEKEAGTGRDMSTASSSLAAANAKIQIAANAVAALKAYLPTASSTASASTTINLDTARSLASAAQDAIKAAQKALTDVVVDIAHSMGLKIGHDEHIEATSTATNTSQ